VKKKKIMLIIFVFIICFSLFLIISKLKKQEYLVVVNDVYYKQENLNEIINVGGEITNEYFYPIVTVQLNENQVEKLRKNKHIKGIQKNEKIKLGPDIP
jgi:hypothetical protein